MEDIKITWKLIAVVVFFGILFALPLLGSGGETAFWVIAIVVGSLALYFLPSIVGAKKKNVNAIFMLNLFLGWTLIGWVVALVWAATVEDAPATAPTKNWICNKCHGPVRTTDKFCPSCATEMKWVA